MRFFITVIIIAVAAAIAEWFGPWWLAAIAAIIGGWASRLSTWKALWAGFLAIALLWLAAFLIRDLPNGHLLSTKLAVLFFKTPSYPAFMLTTVLLGGIIGGLGGWSGAHLRRAIRSAKL